MTQFFIKKKGENGHPLTLRWVYQEGQNVKKQVVLKIHFRPCFSKGRVKKDSGKFRQGSYSTKKNIFGFKINIKHKFQRLRN